MTNKRDTTQKTNSAIPVDITWMPSCSKILSNLLKIERRSVEHPWSAPEFKALLDKSSCVGMIAKDKHGNILGYMIYENSRSKIQLLTLVVAKSERNQGIGTAMVDKLILKLRSNEAKRERLFIEIRETNLQGQLFLQRRGFRGSDVLRNHFDDTNEDAFVMEIWNTRD